MTVLVQKVRRAIRKRNLLATDENALVAVSGGADSVVLLHVLHELARATGWRLEVAHFNHCLRGTEADADAAWVRAGADRWGLPCHVEAADVQAHAAGRRQSLEMAGRDLRHAFLARTAVARGIRKIALGHHADDQVETFFLRLLRGSAGTGIAGLRWSNPSPADPRVQLVRPLLDCSRDELRTHARETGLEWREDASNARPDALRNRIRHRLLGLLEAEFQPGLRAVILRWLDIAGGNADLAARLARRWLDTPTDSRDPFDTLHVAVQREVLLRQFTRLGLPPDFEQIEQLRQWPGKPVTLAPDCALLRDATGTLQRESPSVPVGFSPQRRSVTLDAPGGQMTFGGLEIAWEYAKGEPAFPVQPPPGTEFLDLGPRGSRVLLRHWQPGDRFRPLSAPGAAKLQDIFTNERVPRSERHRRVIAENESGEIFWVEGLRPGECARLRLNTRCWLRWSWRRRPVDEASEPSGA